MFLKKLILFGTGANILNMALVSKSTFNSLKTWVSDCLVFRYVNNIEKTHISLETLLTLFFRAKSDVYQMYSPKHVFVTKYAKIPSSATHVTLSSEYYDYKDEVPYLPSSVVYFHTGKAGLNHHFGVSHNCEWDIEKLRFSLPNTLTSLHYLGFTLKYLPPSLTELTTFYLPTYLPSNLIYLDVNYTYFKKNSITSWPVTLKHLKINMSGCYLDLFPSLPSLLSLEYMGWEFPKAQLPTSLQSLKLIGCLPSTLQLPSLTSLKIDGAYELDNLPPNLTSLELENITSVTCSFPDSLRTLKISKIKNITSVFPTQLTHLTCDILPSSILPALTYLHTKALPDSYDLPLLTHLRLSDHSNPVFPPNITSLDVESLNTDPSVFFLASKITHLCLGGTAEINALPPLLRHLTLRVDYCSPLPSLPNTLISLTLNIGFNLRLPPLPLSLKKLLFPFNCKYSYRLPDLPASLTYLFLPGSYDIPLPNVPTGLLRLQCMYIHNNTRTYFI